MALTTRAGKGSALTHAEMDANFTGLANGTNRVGVTDGSNASAGMVGEVISVVSPVTGFLTTGVPFNITSIELTPGDWDITAVALFDFGGTTLFTQLIAGISRISLTLPSNGIDSVFNGNSQASLELSSGSVPGAVTTSIVTPTVTLSTSIARTIYLVCQAAFITSTITVHGTLRARRMR